jgi:hypothetical protein
MDVKGNQTCGRHEATIFGSDADGRKRPALIIRDTMKTKTACAKCTTVVCQSEQTEKLAYLSMKTKPGLIERL